MLCHSISVKFQIFISFLAIITATSKSTTTTEKTKPVTHAPLRHVTTTAVGAAGRRGRVLTQSIKATTEDVSREGETCKNRLDHITCLYYVKLGYCYTQSSLNYMRQFCCAACKGRFTRDLVFYFVNYFLFFSIAFLHY